MSQSFCVDRVVTGPSEAGAGSAQPIETVDTMELTLAALQAMGVELGRCVGTFDSDLVTPAQAVAVVEAAESIVRHATALRLLAAGRASSGNAWRGDGRFASPGEWFADATGVGVGDARRTLEAAGQLAALPDVAGSLRSGELSQRQVEEIAAAASVDPAAQGELLEAARRKPFQQLKGLCRTVKNRARSAEDDEARAARQHRLRRATCTVDDDGMGWLTAKLSPERMGEVWGAVEAEADRLFREARADGRRDPAAAYRADAIYNLVMGGTGRDKARPAPLMLIRVDWAALARGHCEAGEVCDVPGVGEISVTAARRLLPEALLRVLVADGVDIKSVATVTRTVRAALDTALRWRDPQCVVPDCGRTQRLERHHWQQDFGDGGPTSLENVCRVCRPHHVDITRNGYQLEGGPGRWRLIPPGAAAGGPGP